MNQTNKKSGAHNKGNRTHELLSEHFQSPFDLVNFAIGRAKEIVHNHEDAKFKPSINFAHQILDYIVDDMNTPSSVEVVPTLAAIDSDKEGSAAEALSPSSEEAEAAAVKEDAKE